MAGTLESVARANLWLRTASRVVVRVAEFRATAFFELELQAKRIPWERFVAPGSRVDVRVTCRKSKLYHSDAVAQRFAEAIAWRVKGASASESTESDDDEAGAATERQLFIVRFFHDVCTVSADSSGALLHLRGYRQALAKAPMRETLAAAVLLGAAWTGETPLVDPMCGAGTIPIEAALIARRMAPGRARSFAFAQWPEFNAPTWTSVLADAKSRELERAPVRIMGSDRDAGAIVAARANAERAGVTGDVEFATQPISALRVSESGEPGVANGLIASNPPYGVRVGEHHGLRDLYAQLGNVARRCCPGWQVALLSAERSLERQTKLPFTNRFATRNGGIAVRLVVAPVGDDLGQAPNRAARR